MEAQAKLVDVGPTLAALAAVPDTDLHDALGDPLDGRVLTAYRLGEPLTDPKVIGILGPRSGQSSS